MPKQAHADLRENRIKQSSGFLKMRLRFLPNHQIVTCFEKIAYYRELVIPQSSFTALKTDAQYSFYLLSVVLGQTYITAPSWVASG